MMSSSKRKRVEVSIKIKKEICLYKEQNPAKTLNEIRKYVLDKHSIDIGKSTIGDILQGKGRWFSVPVGVNEEHTRELHAKHSDLEKALFLWLSNVSANHAAVNDEMMIQKAKALGHQLNITGFNYSHGWLQRFKNRHGIKKRLYQGEADSADIGVVSSGRETLSKILSEYELENIFNLDETGLFYKLGPNYTLATNNVSGTKRPKDRITVALACNATGTTKMKPFVITKVNRPRCFGKTYDPNTYVRYRHNSKAWMTADLFMDWLKNFDQTMVGENRKVILLVDNASSHTQGDLELRNVRLYFLPPNTTAHLQPMDAGIIKAFKAHYRKQLVRHYIEAAEENRDQVINLKEALSMVKVAWDNVSMTTISNCFKHTKIVPDVPSDDVVVINEDNDNSTMNELADLLHRIEGSTVSAEDYCQVCRYYDLKYNYSLLVCIDQLITINSYTGR